MKILLYTDNHFCENSSIVCKMGDKFTQRLENQIKSINWAENLAYENGCQCVICAGDFFDKPDLTQQELTALNDINWAPLSAHFFLVGNHESEESDLRYNSTQALLDDRKDTLVVSKPELISKPGFELAFLPYIVESDRRPISEYFPPLGEKKRLLVSHNDLLGVQMGPVVSVVGFKPEELAAACTLCVNGHLHNGQKINDKVINLGNLTGKDLGEDAFRYSHNVMLLDTDTFAYKLIENPYALNFYKIEINDENDIKKLLKLKNNAAISVKCAASLAKDVKDTIDALDNVVSSRLTIVRDAASEDSVFDISELSMDQYAKFAECCRLHIESSDILEQELAMVLR